MTSFISDSESDIERLSSVKSIPESFETVPLSTDYQFRMFGSGCSKAGTRVSYELKKDKPLPYSAPVATKKGQSNCLNVRFEWTNITTFSQNLYSSFQSSWFHQRKVLRENNRESGGFSQKV